MTITYERAKLLMDVIKGSADLGPRDANSLSALAAAELTEMDNEAKAELDARAKKAADEAAKQLAIAAEKAKAQAAAAEKVDTTYVERRPL
jgi:hypothetical protein